jgi:hypothetical protein
VQVAHCAHAIAEFVLPPEKWLRERRGKRFPASTTMAARREGINTLLKESETAFTA